MSPTNKALLKRIFAIIVLTYSCHSLSGQFLIPVNFGDTSCSEIAVDNYKSAFAITALCFDSSGVQSRTIVWYGNATPSKIFDRGSALCLLDSGQIMIVNDSDLISVISPEEKILRTRKLNEIHFSKTGDCFPGTHKKQKGIYLFHNDSFFFIDKSLNVQFLYSRSSCSITPEAKLRTFCTSGDSIIMCFRTKKENLYRYDFGLFYNGKYFRLKKLTYYSKKSGAAPVLRSVGYNNIALAYSINDIDTYLVKTTLKGHKRSTEKIKNCKVLNIVCGEDGILYLTVIDTERFLLFPINYDLLAQQLFGGIKVYSCKLR